MPRKKRDTANPDARRNSVGVQLTDDELAMVRRVAARYGNLSMSAAARLLILAGAPQHDPSPPIEGA